TCRKEAGAVFDFYHVRTLEGSRQGGAELLKRRSARRTGAAEEQRAVRRSRPIPPRGGRWNYCRSGHVVLPATRVRGPCVPRPASLVTVASALIPDPSANLQPRRSPLVVGEREQQNSSSPLDAILRIRNDVVESAQLFAAGAGDDFGDPFRRIEDAV